ncbi:hypothetical protein GOQ29_09405 [Clostridium sp. D2Q-14]|uniref:hypothetical protein n=1 Tax=Anaeromonas gelatinilytica TaxID=2683194 RepID=UPI00193AFEDC|nr:hypothetical protein [Anaeromonas gelatinilytica]MBS4535830.1 hypothetical protein [Anaeromonas gelatinilytica]
MASIKRNIKTYFLDTKIKIRTPSGASKEYWDIENSIEIKVSIYDVDDTINTQSVKYNDSSHIGLTKHKSIKEGINRLRNDFDIYNIISSKPQGRYTQLLLKRIDTDV